MRVEQGCLTAPAASALSPWLFIELDDDLRVTAASADILPLFGVPADELVGRWLDEVASTPDPHAATVREAIDGARRGWVDRFVIVDLGAQRRVGRLLLRSSEGGFVAAIEPITEGSHLGALLRLRAQWRTVLRESNDGIALTDTSLRVLEHNQQFLTLMEVGEEVPSLRGQFLLDRLHPDFEPVVRGLSAEDPCGGGFDGVINHGSKRLIVQLSPCQCPVGELQGYSLVVHDATAETEINRLATAIKQTHDAVVLTDKRGTIQYVNPAFEALTGYSRQEAIGANPRVLKSGAHGRQYYADMWSTLTSGHVWRGRIHNRKKDGATFIEDASISPILDEHGEIFSYVAVKKEITEQLQMEARLRQAQKLESIGQLAAGIAHEINTPTQYVSDNVAFLKRAFSMLTKAVDASQKVLDAADAGTLDASCVAKARRAFKRANLDFLLAEVPEAIAQSQEGLERVTRIVGAMKEFSHPSNNQVKPVDLNHAIETTVTVARSEWKYVANVELELDPTLPAIPALRDQFNQVILNILVNAAHAIGDATRGGADGKGTITIRTGLTEPGDAVFVRISDTGTGIPDEVLSRIFDPFFTTKEIGKGTGQGLAIAHSVIVDKHGGTINVETESGVGTTLIVELPLVPAAS